MSTSKTTEQRFWEKVSKTDGCWEWESAIGRAGYGKFWLNGKVKETHRVAFELTHGPIPEGLQVCHSCDNPRCVNPSHLWLGTQAENIQDMYDKQRAGARIRKAVDMPKKLSAAKVTEIRALYAGKRYSQSELGKMFDVSQPTIGEVIRREIWKHV